MRENCTSSLSGGGGKLLPAPIRQLETDEQSRQIDCGVGGRSPKRGGHSLKPAARNFFTAAVLVASVVLPSSAEGTGIPMLIHTDEVHIVNSGSTNTLGFTLTISENGTAILEQGNSTERKHLPLESVARFFAALRASGPLDALPATLCLKSASFGTTMRIFFEGKASPDISCPNPNVVVQELAREATALVGAAGAKVVPRRPLPSGS
jgi:hypothetical protein